MFSNAYATVKGKGEIKVVEETRFYDSTNYAINRHIESLLISLCVIENDTLRQSTFLNNVSNRLKMRYNLKLNSKCNISN